MSGSADNTVRVVSVVQHAAGSLGKYLLLVTESVNIKSCKARKLIIIVLLAILVAVIAIFGKQYFPDDPLECTECILL